MFKKKFSFFKNNQLYYLTFLTSLVIMAIVYLLKEITPFGDGSTLTVDFYHQYSPMLAELYDRIKTGANLTYSFSFGLGLPFIRNYMNYLASPFNFLLLLFKREHLVTAFSLIIALKAASAATTMVFYLSRKFFTKNKILIALGISYSFGAYFMAYYWNIMWLDGLIMLPLIIYGIEKLVDEGKIFFYIISLSLMLVFNYYIGYVICLFSVLYFIGYLILKTERFNFKIIIKKVLSFTIASLLAGGLGAVLLYPLFLGLDSISATSDAWPTSQYYAFTFLDYLVSHFAGVDSTITAVSINQAPNIVGGTLGCYLLVLFFFNPHIQRKIKLVYLSMLLFIAISFFYAPLDFIWHAFHIPNDMPYRYSFIYTFLLMVISAYSLKELKYLKHKIICLVYLMFLCSLSLLKILNYTGITSNMVILGQVSITIYFILTMLHTSPKLKKVIPYLLCLTVMTESILVFSHLWQSNAKVSEYYQDYLEVKEVLNFIKENDSGVYRLEKASLLTANDASWYGYYGQSGFSSMTDESLAILQKKLGLPNNNINHNYYQQTTPINDLIFNIKYFLGESIDTKHYSLLTQTKALPVYVNHHNAGLMYAVNEEIVNWELDDSNPFANQNVFIEKGTGILNVLKPFSYQAREIVYSTSEETIIKYTFKPTTPQGYFYLDATKVNYLFIGNTLNYQGNPPKEGNGLPNGSFFAALKLFDYVKIDSLKSVIGSQENIWVTPLGAEITELYISYKTSLEQGFYSYLLDEEAFALASQKFQKNRVVIDEFKESSIKGHITLAQKQTIFTSIPYDKGWQVAVDDVKISTFAIGEALLGFKVPAGEHEITLKYQMPGREVGLLTSLISLVILGFLHYKKNPPSD